MKPTNDRDRAAYLRRLAEGWLQDLRRMGACPRRRPGRATYNQRQRPWLELRAAIDGALALAEQLEEFAQQTTAQAAAMVATVEPRQRLLELRRAGWTFTAAAQLLSIPVGTAKTWARTARMEGAA